MKREQIEATRREQDHGTPNGLTLANYSNSLCGTPRLRRCSSVSSSRLKRRTDDRSVVEAAANRDMSCEAARAGAHTA
jgi:hypothetical protein